jgi:dihydrofolate synthase/folylpolyglutamate synthase
VYDYDALTRKLFSRTTKGIKLGLERMATAADALGNPQHATPSIHVAGTNGKGSVCALIESMLRACGFTTGLFIKPHLLRLEERFLINGRPVGTGEMLESYAAIDRLVDRHDLTFFEATTLLAFELFRRHKVRWAIYETGLGGRLDSTTIVMPRVSVITRIAMDHRQYLGDTIERIAAEKLGIVKPRVPLVMIEPPEESVRRLTEQLCDECEAPLTLVRASEMGDPCPSATGTALSWHGSRFHLPLPGPHQPMNALCALEAMRCVGVGEPACLARGMARVRLPGRFQVVRAGERRCVLDVGHNPDAVAAHVAALTQCMANEAVWFVVGVMADKEYPAMVRALCTYEKTTGVILTRPATERAVAAEVLRHAVPDTFAGEVCVKEPVADALEYALGQRGGVVSVVGSFYTVGEAMTALGVTPYGSTGENR